jgi:tetratricopeptide (TPR) repeat protein
MAVTIEGFCVVVKKDRIAALFDAEKLVPPNGMFLADDEIWRCGFMAESDAQNFLKTLESLDLNVTTGPDSDAVIVNEFNQEIHPYCEWLETTNWEKAIIAWKAGTEPKKVVAMEGFDPAVGSGLSFHDPKSMDHLEFLRLEDKVEVFLNKETGEEVFIGRTTDPLESMYQSATESVRKHFRMTGEAILTGEEAEEVTKATEMLQKVSAELPQFWQAFFFLGKGQVALGQLEEAYQSFKRAVEIEQEVEGIPRELGGVCLELGRFEEAVETAQHAASLEPDNPETLGNLALTYLMAEKIEPAQKAIASAIKLAPDDEVNQNLDQIIRDVVSGKRDQPRSMADLMS